MGSGNVTKIAKLLADNVETVIKGKRRAIELSVTAFLCEGHLLIEDVPGVGKTVLAKSLSRSVDGDFKRIQFTPDLLPSDITGANLYNQKTGEFVFQPGPVFTNILLADEINRTTPRTQSALLEAMDERHVTIDGETRELPAPFFVIATQNPMEYHGTYPLPEGQLDRFLMSISLGYPDFEHELEIVDQQRSRHPIETLKPVMTAADVLLAQEAVRAVVMEPPVVDYALKLVAATREADDLLLGASPRGTLALTRTARGFAAVNGRDFVLPDDVKAVAVAVLAHRVFIKPKLRVGESAPRNVIEKILDTVPVPVGS